MMKVLLGTFGDEIIPNMCIVYTRWGSDESDIRKRMKQNPPLTEEFKIKESHAFLLEEFGRDFPNLPIYFTDTMEIEDGTNNDATSETIKELYTDASSYAPFDCRNLIACEDWAERYCSLMSKCDGHTALSHETQQDFLSEYQYPL